MRPTATRSRLNAPPRLSDASRSFHGSTALLCATLFIVGACSTDDFDICSTEGPVMQTFAECPGDCGFGEQPASCRAAVLSDEPVEYIVGVSGGLLFTEGMFCYECACGLRLVRTWHEGQIAVDIAGPPVSCEQVEDGGGYGVSIRIDDNGLEPGRYPVSVFFEMAPGDLNAERHYYDRDVPIIAEDWHQPWLGELKMVMVIP